MAAGSAVVIWQMLVLFSLQKVLYSLWTLINILQFFIFIGLWQVVYPDVTGVIMIEIKRISNGEFLEGL